MSESQGGTSKTRWIVAPIALVLTESSVVSVQAKYPDSPKTKKEFCGTKDVSVYQQIQR